MLLNALGWFFSGVLLVNVLPHLIHGISGDRFPSAFDKPHGRRLSSPTRNVLWAFINVSILLIIYHFNGPSFSEVNAVIMLIGAFTMALFLSRYFANKEQG